MYIVKYFLKINIVMTLPSTVFVQDPKDVGIISNGAPLICNINKLISPYMKRDA